MFYVFIEGEYNCGGHNGLMHSANSFHLRPDQWSLNAGIRRRERDDAGIIKFNTEKMVYPLKNGLLNCIFCHSFVYLQDSVLNIINQIMDECIPNDRANRDFSVKFPEEIRHDNLAGQLWFGAEVPFSLEHPSRGKQSCTSPTFVHKHIAFTVKCAVVNIIC